MSARRITLLTTITTLLLAIVAATGSMAFRLTKPSKALASRSTPPADTIYMVGGSVSEPVGTYLSGSVPSIRRRRRRRGLTGVVKLNAVIDEFGVVSSVEPDSVSQHRSLSRGDGSRRPVDLQARDEGREASQGPALRDGHVCARHGTVEVTGLRIRPPPRPRRHPPPRVLPFESRLGSVSSTLAKPVSTRTRRYLPAIASATASPATASPREGEVAVEFLADPIPPTRNSTKPTSSSRPRCS